MKTDTTRKENVAIKKQNVIKQENWHTSKYMGKFWLGIIFLLSITDTMKA